MRAAALPRGDRIGQLLVIKWTANSMIPSAFLRLSASRVVLHSSCTRPLVRRRGQERDARDGEEKGEEQLDTGGAGYLRCAKCENVEGSLNTLKCFDKSGRAVRAGRWTLWHYRTITLISTDPPRTTLPSSWLR